MRDKRQKLLAEESEAKIMSTIINAGLSGVTFDALLKETGLAKSTLYKHLRILEEQGFIEKRPPDVMRKWIFVLPEAAGKVEGNLPFGLKPEMQKWFKYLWYDALGPHARPPYRKEPSRLRELRKLEKIIEKLQRGDDVKPLFKQTELLKEYVKLRRKETRPRYFLKCQVTEGKGY